MIFETLFESAQRGELLLVDGGFCHWHLRRDGQLTIREIISTRKGAGSEMLARLKQIPGARSIFARCPADLESNQWYERKGFKPTGTMESKSGRAINEWRLMVNAVPPQSKGYSVARIRKGLLIQAPGTQCLMRILDSRLCDELWRKLT